MGNCNPTYKGQRYDSMEELYKIIAHENVTNGVYPIDSIIKDELHSAAYNIEDEFVPDYTRTLNFKISILNTLQNRLRQIEQLKKDNASNKDVLHTLNKLENNINKRLGSIESGEGLINEVNVLKTNPTADIFNFYVQNDFDRVRNLLNSKDTEDINEARKTIIFYKSFKLDNKKRTSII